MALNPIMRQTIRWMAESIRRFAESRHWPPAKYRLFFRVNEAWSILDFLLAVDGLNASEMKEFWQALWNHMGDDMKHHAPSPFTTHGFSVRTFDQMAEGGIYRLDPSWEEIEFPEDHGSPTSASLLASTI